jgi:putative transcriptional regulator
MPGQHELLEKVQRILATGGFEVSEACFTKPRCFDLVARRERTILLLKTLYNIDALKFSTAKELRAVAKLLEGSPLVVGEKSRESRLERGVVYSRHNIPIVNLATLYDFFVRRIYPMVYSAPGGYYVSLQTEVMKEVRLAKNLSLGDLAKLVGVSRRAIKKYEDGMDATVETALRLEKVLETYLIKAIDLIDFEFKEEIIVDDDEYFQNMDEREREIAESLMNIGFDVYPTPYAPFDAVSMDKHKDSTILTGMKDSPKIIEKRATIIGNISKVTNKKAAYIVDDVKEAEIDGTVMVKRELLESVSNVKDFLAFLDELLSSEKYI